MGVGVMFGSGVGLGTGVAVLVGAGIMVRVATKLPGCETLGAFTRSHTKVISNKKIARPTAPSITPGVNKRRNSKFILFEMIPDLTVCITGKSKLVFLILAIPG